MTTNNRIEALLRKGLVKDTDTITTVLEIKSLIESSEDDETFSINLSPSDMIGLVNYFLTGNFDFIPDPESKINDDYKNKIQKTLKRITFQIKNLPFYNDLVKEYNEEMTKNYGERSATDLLNSFNEGYQQETNK